MQTQVQGNDVLIKKKKCFRCGVNKQLVFFGPRRDAPDGRSNRCRRCDRMRKKDERAPGRTGREFRKPKWWH